MSKTKIIIIGIVVILIFGGYTLFFKNDAEPADKLASSATNSEKKIQNQVGAEMLSALSVLEKLSLDTSFFQDGVFRGLKNFSRPIQAQPVGRQNPFAQIGSSGQVSTTTNITR